MKKISNIAILTSGGDSPGMNKTIMTIVDNATKHGIKSFVVLNGFEGLYTDRIREANVRILENNANLAGSCILSSRFPQFKDDEVTKVCIENLKKHKIDLVFVLGGNGSYQGARKLKNFGIDVIGLPCTIDNDIAHTEFTIGFDSALNAVTDTIDMLKTTCDTHGNTMLVEIMGRHCSDLTIAASSATNVDYIVTPYNIIDKDKFCDVVQKIRSIPHKKSALILITELMYTGKEGAQMSLSDLRAYIEEKTKIPTKTHVIGFVQRGAKQTAIERYNASRMASFAVECAVKGIVNVAVGINGPTEHYTSIDEDFDSNESSSKVLKSLENVNIIDFKK
ncbi:MAG: ATP-dependent 6-phosphofructokinase [Mycoplasma sp.]